MEAHDQEEDGHYCPSKEGCQDYYPAEANRNTSASAYPLRCGDGDLEDQEEDIDQIVAEIKISLSMTSITSTSEASPEHGPEPGPAGSAEACPPVKASCRPSRHEVRPKSLNLLPEAKQHGNPQRGFKPKTRTPEERLKWPHEQNGTTEEVTSEEEEEEEMVEDIEDLDHYEMKAEPISGKKLEDEGIEKENLAILEKIRKTERQNHLIVVDPDSPLYSDLQIFKEKEGVGDILLNLSFKELLWLSTGLSS
ncbi:amyloid-beta A4 precursor protein-binding family A member 2-like [Pongo pygmaeus]|uniref:amyloid-beta A4 precursor protein-binding family A member 2-like n=1 Tax=Pongo pygmaeus TaxID=9600 RepID=UPI0023E25014|nr:amyloid-beta A4 precursor protein-binding family A member 2-like [Pongo pygmaeus]